MRSWQVLEVVGVTLVLLSGAWTYFLTDDVDVGESRQFQLERKLDLLWDLQMESLRGGNLTYGSDGYEKYSSEYFETRLGDGNVDWWFNLFDRIDALLFLLGSLLVLLGKIGESAGPAGRNELAKP